MKVSDIIRIGDKIDIRVLQEVEQAEKTDVTVKTYKSKVLDFCSNGNMEIAMPMEAGKLVLLQLGVRYELVFFSRESLDPLDRQYYHAFSDIYKVPMSDQIFVAQSNVIRRLAAHGPCVIVGRCADMILDDSINLFIYSKMRDRIKRILILEPGSDEKEMERRIREVDRKRKEYYQYYTGNTWGRAQNYHLCLDSGLTGVDGCLRAVLAYLGELSE